MRLVGGNDHQVRGPGPEQVDGLSEVHRRGKEEMPGEDPLFRQLPAGDTGDGGRHSSRGVVGAQAPKARQVPVTRCQGGGTAGA